VQTSKKAPTAALAHRAAAAIAERRCAADPIDLATLPGTGDEDLQGLVDYVLRHEQLPASDRVSENIRRADVADAMTIIAYLRGRADRQELSTIHLGRSVGMRWSDLAQITGCRTAQAAQQRADRLTAATEHGVRDARLTRAGRRSDVARKAAAAEVQTKAQRVRTVAEALVRAHAAGELPEADPDDVADLADGLSKWRQGAPLPPLLVDDLRLALITLARLSTIAPSVRGVVDAGLGLLDLMGGALPG
jgi:hypothetical protein